MRSSNGDVNIDPGRHKRGNIEDERQVGQRGANHAKIKLIEHPCCIEIFFFNLQHHAWLSRILLLYFSQWQTNLHTRLLLRQSAPYSQYTQEEALR
jgi:hypothetical protein